MIDAMARGSAFSDKTMVAGHGQAYYSDSSMIPEELFANYLTLKLMNADKQLQAFKEAFPHTYNSLEKLKGEALKVLKEKNE